MQRPQASSAALAIAGVVFVSTAYFYQGSGWNQNSRFDLVRALAERGTVRIDAYHQNTGDKAYRRGHFYSDKAPGAAFTALPIVLATRWIIRAGGGDPTSRASLTAQLYMATIAVGALAATASALLVAALVVRLGGSSAAGTVAAFVFALGTPTWVHATLFLGHTLATLCILGAFATICGARERAPGPGGAAATGFLLTWACVVEYPSVPPAAVLFLAGAYRISTGVTAPRRWILLGAQCAGALLPLLVIAGYNAAAFGHPLSFSYTYVSPLFSGMQSGVMGVTYPKPAVLYYILFSEYRGLFFHAPALLAAPVGVYRLLTGEGARRRAVWALVAIPVYYVLMNGAYVYWEGGWCYGPRHLLPAIPFLAIAVGVAWTTGTWPLRATVLALGMIGAAMSLVVVSTNAQPDSDLVRPLAQYSWPAFRAGQLSRNYHAIWDDLAVQPRPTTPVAWNLGELLGFTGLASLVPLGLCWGAIAWLWRRRARQALR
jgi:hypothetical protein